MITFPIAGQLTSAAATVTTVVPVAQDAYLHSGYPTTNYGTRTTVLADADPARATLVQFSVPSSVAPISRATLRVYANSGSTAGLVVSANGTNWTETSVTWANAPAAGAKLGSVATVASGTWASFDVTSAVTAGAKFSARVTTPGSTQISMAAREAGSATAAQLVVETGTTAQTSPSPSPSPTSSSPSPSPSPTSTTDPQPAFPIRAAFYYPWFPQAWKQGTISPFTWYQPTRGYYDGTDPAVVSAQIADMRYAGMDAGIASWWGQGSKEDLRMPMLLTAAASTPFRWSLYYEAEAYGDPSATQIDSDLSYIKSHYGAAPGFLRIGGKPVIFVYADGGDACGMADRWAAGNKAGFYVVLKVFPGYTKCANQPAGWHQYAAAAPSDSQAPYSYAVSAGFWLRTESKPRLIRDPARFDSNVAAMAASNARFQLVTTYNEWGEGTALESATAWASSSGHGTYIDILHKYLGG